MRIQKTRGHSSPTLRSPFYWNPEKVGISGKKVGLEEKVFFSPSVVKRELERRFLVLEEKSIVLKPQIFFLFPFDFIFDYLLSSADITNGQILNCNNLFNNYSN